MALKVFIVTALITFVAKAIDAFRGHDYEDD